MGLFLGNKKTLQAWLFELEHRHVQEIQLDLSRVSLVGSDLELLHWDCPIITVAGTNGKGSTVAALESLYVSAGYRVGSYTSPHLLTFHERIKYNRIPISDDDLCNAFAAIEAASLVSLTYFEVTTLAALWYFKSLSLDVLILEVGMGGRLDATNALDADLAIITTIDLDHQAFLGETREAIGFEKAGIIRRGKPVLFADDNPPDSVVSQAKLLDAPLYRFNSDYSFEVTDERLTVRVSSTKSLTVPKPALHLKAAAAALVATECLQFRLPVSLIAQQEAMQVVSIVGRQQVVKGDTITVFDVAHNPQAVLALSDFIRAYKPKRRVHAVFSCLKDKDLCGLIKPMRELVAVWYPAVVSGVRAATASRLLDAYQVQQITVDLCYDDPRMAYEAALQNTVPGDLIVVYGSFLTVSAVIGLKGEEGV